MIKRTTEVKYRHILQQTLVAHAGGVTLSHPGKYLGRIKSRALNRLICFGTYVGQVSLGNTKTMAFMYINFVLIIT